MAHLLLCVIKRINSFKQCYSKFCVFPFVEYHEPVQIVLDGQLTQCHCFML